MEQQFRDQVEAFKDGQDLRDGLVQQVQEGRQAPLDQPAQLDLKDGRVLLE
jgi:hypothetical protein